MNEDKLKQAMRRQLLLGAGFSGEEIDKLDIDNMRDEEFQDIMREKLLDSKASNGVIQKLVSVEELSAYFEQGWQFISTINGDKVVIGLS
jgi:hypothetical protein